MGLWPSTLFASLLVLAIGLHWASQRLGVHRVDRWCFACRDRLPIPFLLVGLIARLITRTTSAWPRWRGELAMLGLVLIILGESLRVWAVGIVGAATRSSSTHAKRLVAEGPYALTRNPIYIGNFVLCLGLACFSGSWVAAMACTAYFLIVYTRIIRAEERFLQTTFGGLYRDYCRRVPRWLPRWRVAWHELRAPFSLRELRKEHQTVAGIVCAALLIHTVVHQPWQGWLGSHHAATQLASVHSPSPALPQHRVTTITLEQALQGMGASHTSSIPLQQPVAPREAVAATPRRMASSPRLLGQLAAWLRRQLPSALAGGVAFAGTYLASDVEGTYGEEFEEQLPGIAGTTLIALAVHSVVSQMANPSVAAFASDHAAGRWTLSPSLQADREDERIGILVRIQF